MSDLSRKVIVFPTSQFSAVIGEITLGEDPFALTLPDILNDKSSATHQAREHLHRSGKIFLSEVEAFSLGNDRRRICHSLKTVHLPVNQVATVVDYFPDKYRGNREKRLEYRERKVVEDDLRFVLQDHVICGVADQKEIYRRSECFLGLSRLRFEEAPRDQFSLPDFFEEVGCPLPEYMAVNLARVFHS